MPAKEWATPAQKRYLMSKLTAYMAATDIANHKSLYRFWVTLNEGWFELFPVRTTTDLVAIGDEIENTKEQLKTWMRYRAARRRRAAGTGPSSGGGDGGGSSIGAALAGSSSGSGGGRASKTRSLFSVLKRTKEIRPYRPIEVYQKVYNLKISQEVMAWGYGLLNEETESAAAAADASASSSADVMTLTDEEIRAAAEKETEAIEARIHKNRQLRMSMWRRAAIELYDAEDDEVKAEIKAEMEAMNAERAARAGGDTDESTPEDYQHAIDQLRDVAEQVLKSIGEATGWHLCLLAGGPMPNRAGAISTKTICYGTTALGSDFQASHPTFDDSVKAHFNKFLKRAFPHEVRDARGIVDNSQGIARAIAIDDEGNDETAAAGEASKPKPPKRIRHPKRSTAAPAPGPAVPPAVLFPTSNAVPVPTDAADLSEPDAIADSPLPIPAGFDETMDAIASEYGASADIPFGWDGAGLDLGGVTVQHATFDAAGEDLIALPPPPSSSPSPVTGGSRASLPASDRWGSPVSSPLFRPSVLLQAFTKTLVPMRATPWGSTSTSVASSVIGVPNATPPALPSAAASLAHTPPLSSWLPATAPSSSPFGNAQSTKSPVSAVPQPAAVSTTAPPPVVAAECHSRSPPNAAVHLHPASSAQQGTGVLLCQLGKAFPAAPIICCSSDASDASFTSDSFYSFTVISGGGSCCASWATLHHVAANG
ncbi:hypothetical protein B0H14DRAFT_3496337 [Mycena olivaceomarginata]|nr:hypothetical protein B0H14DRAFT_3496337 [Mycena olivaceomarginata]